MPDFIVTSPQGQEFHVTAPEGATQDQALAYAQQQFAANHAKAVASAAASYIPPEKPSLLASIGRGMMDVGQGVKQLWLSGQSAPNPDGTPPGQAAKDYTAKVNDELALYDKGRGKDAGIDWGRIGGNMVATAPLGLLVPGAGAGLAARVAAGAGAGAAQGGVMFDKNNEHGMNALVGGVVGGALPAAGALLKKGVQSLSSNLTPNAQDLISLADAKGIPLTSSQRTGSKLLDAVESSTGKLPFSGAEEGARGTQDAYNKALADTMGETLKPGETQLSPDIMKRAGDRIGAEFDKIAAGKPVPVGADLHNAVNAIDAANNSNEILRDPKITELVDEARQTFAPRVSGAPRAISGEEAQALRSRFAAEAAAAGKSTTPGSAQRADFYRTMRDATQKSVESTLSPDETAAWKAAQAQYGNFKTISNALGGSAGETGDVSGAQLWGAIKAREAKGSLAKNTTELAQLASLGKDILKNKTPDSGTALRTLIYDAGKTAAGTVGLAAGGEELGRAKGHPIIGGVAALAAGALTSQALRTQFIAAMIKDGALPAAAATMTNTAQKAITAAIIAGKTQPQDNSNE